jgi:hypothetical protein
MATVWDKILAQDSRIRFAMVVDEKGQIVESKILGDSLVSREDISAFAGLWTGVIGGVARELEKYLGTGLGLSVYYDRLNIHGFPLGDNTVVIAARKDLPFETVLSLQRAGQA